MLSLQERLNNMYEERLANVRIAFQFPAECEALYINFFEDECKMFEPRVIASNGTITDPGHFEDPIFNHSEFFLFYCFQ